MVEVDTPKEVNKDDKSPGICILRAHFIQPKIRGNFSWKSNGTHHFSSVRPGTDLEPPLKVVHFDRSAHSGRSDRNVPFHWTKLLSPVPLFCSLLARIISKRAVAWVGSVQPECTFALSNTTTSIFKLVPETIQNHLD